MADVPAQELDGEPVSPKGDPEDSSNVRRIRRHRITESVRALAKRDSAGNGVDASEPRRGLTRAGNPADTETREEGDPASSGSAEEDAMARKPRGGEVPPNYYKALEEDPTIPKPDIRVGPQEDQEPSKPMADLSKPEDFPPDVQAIIESAPK